MDKIPIWMDLVAGILLAIDLFQKYRIISKVYDNIKQFVKNIDTKDLTNIKTLIFSGVLSIFTFILALLRIYYLNSNNVDYNTWKEIGCFALGIIIAWGLITSIAKILKRGPLGMLLIGLVLLVVTTTIVFTQNPSPYLAAATASFVLICILYPLAMSLAHIVKKLLLADEKRPFYMFAILGIILFIVSKTFELAK